MFILALLLQTSAAPSQPPFDPSQTIPNAIKHCRIEWPDDFAMQDHCLVQQRNGFLEFKRSSDEFGKVIEKAQERCIETWTKDKIPDWQMIGYCSRQQADSLRRRRY